jgi:hypothetical protein
MKKIAEKKMGEWSTPRVHGLIKRDFKRRFKQRITTLDINNIWASYVEEEILNTLRVGGIAKLDDKTKIWVKATKPSDNKRVMALLEKGLMYVGGRVTEAKLNFDSSDYIYKIVLETTRYKKNKQIFFKPHQDLRDAVTEGIKKGKLITRLQCQ